MNPGFTACYEKYRQIFSGCRLPLAFVDLDNFDKNVAFVAKTQEKTGKTIRIASKSIRSPDLIRRVFDMGGNAFRGILSFTVEEACFLADNGFDDIVVAYPSIQKTDLALAAEKTAQGCNICLMADCREHLAAISSAARDTGTIIKVCLDIDMSFRPFGKFFHMGVRRSPVHGVDQALALALAAKDMPGIQLAGIMGYEAQIASVNDDLPCAGIKNMLIRAFKKISARELAGRRIAIADALTQAGISIEFFNGGGSGSLVSTGADTAVTEVTAGSAFYAPGLFRYFHEVSFLPSAFFALQTARIPAPGIITCQGGGYTASGEVNVNRLPWPVMPEGMSYLPMEGAGEVQTPLKLAKKCRSPAIGDPVFFQHAKAGELCERFNCLYLVEQGKIAGKSRTYRGLGKAFL